MQHGTWYGVTQAKEQGPPAGGGGGGGRCRLVAAAVTRVVATREATGERGGRESSMTQGGGGKEGREEGPRQVEVASPWGRHERSAYVGVVRHKVALLLAPAPGPRGVQRVDAKGLAALHHKLRRAWDGLQVGLVHGQAARGGGALLVGAAQPGGQGGAGRGGGVEGGSQIWGRGVDVGVGVWVGGGGALPSRACGWLSATRTREGVGMGMRDRTECPLACAAWAQLKLA